MKPEIIKEKYTTNMPLNALYDVLDALYDKYNSSYPDDVKSGITGILNTINKHIYNDHKGFDLIEDNYFSEFTFKKNGSD